MWRGSAATLDQHYPVARTHLDPGAPDSCAPVPDPVSRLPISARSVGPPPREPHGTDLAAPSSMTGLRQDLRGAFRLLTRSPGFGAVVILTLGLAIGATTSVFSIVRGLLLQPLPYPEAGRLVRFFGSSRLIGTGTVSPAELRADHEHLSSMSGVAAWAYGGGTIVAPSGAEHISFGRA